MPTNPAEAILRAIEEFRREYDMPTGNDNAKWSYTIKNADYTNNPQKDNTIAAARNMLETISEIFGDTSMSHTKNGKSLREAFLKLEKELNTLDKPVTLDGAGTYKVEAKF